MSDNSRAEIDRLLNEHRADEIHFLQKLATILRQGKQELINDLSRLAVKNMPLMIEDNYQSSACVTVNQMEMPNRDVEDQHELEPLDLDL